MEYNCADYKNKIWDDNEEINIKDMVCHIVLKWRLILAFMLAAGAVYVGFTAYQSYGIFKEYSGGISYADYEMATYKQNMDAEEIELVEKDYAAYLKTCRDYSQQKEYLNNSILFQLNPYAVSKWELVFLVKTDVKEDTQITGQDFTSDIITALFDSLDDSFYENAMQKTELETDISHIKELFNCYESNHKAVIAIYGSNKEMCSILADLVRDDVENMRPLLMEDYGNFDIKLIGDDYTENYDADLLEIQTELNDGLTDKKDAYDNFLSINLKNYSAYQEAYFNKLNKTESSAEIQQSSEESVFKFALGYISVKSVITSFLVGFLICCIVQALAYILSPKLKNSDNIKDATDTAILGILNAENNNRKINMIDNLIYRIFRGNRDNMNCQEQLDMICAGLRIAIEKNSLKKIVITSTIDSTHSIIFQIKERMQGCAFEIEAVKPVIGDKKSLEYFAECDGVLFVEKIQESYLYEIQKEFEMAALCGVPVIGSVVIR